MSRLQWRKYLKGLFGKHMGICMELFLIYETAGSYSWYKDCEKFQVGISAFII